MTPRPDSRCQNDILQSLVVHVGHGTWYDHQAGVGGDPLDLVKHVLRRDEANAMRWLKDQSLIDSPQHDWSSRAA